MRSPAKPSEESRPGDAGIPLARDKTALASLAAQRDEDLVRMIRSDRSPQALQILFLRHRAWMAAWTTGQARRRGLAGEDLRDVQQQAFFALLEVAAEFDPERGGQTQAAPFRALLAVRLTSRVQNFARRQRRAEAHLDRSAAARRALRAGPDEHRGAVSCVTCRAAEDPALGAEQRETTQRLWAAVNQLGETDRRLVEGLASRCSLHALAAQAGVSYRQLRYHWRQLRCRLAKQLSESVD